MNYTTPCSECERLRLLVNDHAVPLPRTSNITPNLSAASRADIASWLQGCRYTTSGQVTRRSRNSGHDNPIEEATWEPEEHFNDREALHRSLEEDQPPEGVVD